MSVLALLVCLLPVQLLAEVRLLPCASVAKLSSAPASFVYISQRGDCGFVVRGGGGGGLRLTFRSLEDTSGDCGLLLFTTNNTLLRKVGCVGETGLVTNTAAVAAVGTGAFSLLAEALEVGGMLPPPPGAADPWGLRTLPYPGKPTAHFDLTYNSSWHGFNLGVTKPQPQPTPPANLTSHSTEPSSSPATSTTQRSPTPAEEDRNE